MTRALESLPRVRRGTVLGVSVGLYVVSLLLPAMYFEKEAPLIGMSVLAQGWWGVLMLNPSWLANPLYVIAAVQFGRARYGRASVFSGAAVVCALCSLFTTKWYFNEADATPITGFGIAFYVWLISQVALLLGGLRLRQDAATAPPGN
ncbi:hypothetical protein KTF37_20020 [Burkholderia multivorans]|uniref:hypothetical protein n=1 Tax=Burkholderia multivorans TaxID=87883 RepID=UPI001C21BF0A|nr:hypothetical protein [Burkholderia multivorans]MBU9679139.1 hypothetical protein [Burkholderia multivorans]